MQNKISIIPAVIPIILISVLIFTGIIFINVNLIISVIFLTVSIIMLILYGLFLLFAYFIPVNSFSENQRILIEKDLSQLNMAISEFSRGNMSIQIPDIKSQKINLKKISSIKVLENQYNNLHSNIMESITDFNGINAAPCKRLFYVGADSYLEGRKCGEIMGKLLEKSGEVAVVVYYLTNTGQYLRRKGFSNVITQKYPGIKIVRVVEDKRSEDTAYSITKKMIEDFPNLKGIYVASGKTPSIVAKAVHESNADIKVICHDLTVTTVEAIKKGLINSALSQNPFEQGYNPVVLTANYLISRKKPVISRKLTLMEEITKKNIALFWNGSQILSETTKRKLEIPVNNAKGIKCKIGVILPSDAGFWKPVYEGVLAAEKKLEPENISVKLVVPDRIKAGDFSADAFKSEIEILLNAGCDGLCLPLFDADLVPYINELVDKGKAVATLNSELSNYRGMLDVIYRHTKHLFEASESLAASSTETSQATNQISSTMKHVLSSTLEQVNQINETKVYIDSLLNNVQDIYKKAEENIGGASFTRKIADESRVIMHESNQALKDAQKTAASTNRIITMLNENSRKISEIIVFIEELASQTKLIAMNSSILAAKAGSHGKGFTVLASEIRNLSDISSKSTGEISELVNAILSSIEGANSMIIDELSGINQALISADKAESSLNNIVESADNNLNASNDIVKAVENMKTIYESVQKAINNLISINKENSCAIEQISASTDEMTQQVHENNKVAISLSDLALSQENLVGQFIVNSKEE